MGITERDIDTIREDLEQDRKGRFGVYEANLSFLKEIFGERFDDLFEVKTTYEEFKKGISSPRNQLYDDEAELWLAAKVLFPEESKNDLVKLWSSFKLKLGRKQKDPVAFEDYAVDLLVLYPEKRSEMNISESYWDELEDRFGTDLYAKNWAGMLYTGAKLRILFPERFEQTMITKEEWTGIKKIMSEELKEIKKIVKDKGRGVSSNFKIGLAYSLAVLIADKIEFTDHGLKLIMKEGEKKEYKQEKLKRPERRM